MRHRLTILIALLAWHCFGNGVAYPSSLQTINSYFDPQVEFLELGVSYGAETEWKLYGPDLSGQYGGMNGVGGLDAVSPELSLFDPTVTDIRGDILGYYDSSDGSVLWTAARPTGYGAVPDYRPAALGSGANIAQSSAWRGLWPDITGYYNIGMRPYDPVSGRWLTFDSLWNARDPNYYTFAGGDPINYFDSDGRFSTQYYYDQNNGLGLTVTSPIQIGGTLDTWVFQRDAEGNWTSFITGANYSFGGQQSSSLISDVSDSVLNTPQIDAAWNQLVNPDFSSGWGVATWVDAGVSLVANSAEAAANVIPIVGTGKALVENSIKAGVESLTKNAVEDTTKGAAEFVSQETTTVYRGVSKTTESGALNPAYEEALQGNATPRGWPDGVEDPAQHNAGQTANSVFTSWTTDPTMAQAFATANGEGVV
ncbi:MAG: RHS repeat-associated core domain-containing protein, partial [Limisphaerales bacterium]